MLWSAVKVIWEWFHKAWCGWEFPMRSLLSHVLSSLVISVSRLSNQWWMKAEWMGRMKAGNEQHLLPACHDDCVLKMLIWIHDLTLFPYLQNYEKSIARMLSPRSLTYQTCRLSATYKYNRGSLPCTLGRTGVQWHAGRREENSDIE